MQVNTTLSIHSNTSCICQPEPQTRFPGVELLLSLDRTPGKGSCSCAPRWIYTLRSVPHLPFSVLHSMVQTWPPDHPRVQISPCSHVFSTVTVPIQDCLTFRWVLKGSYSRIIKIQGFISEASIIQRNIFFWKRKKTERLALRWNINCHILEQADTFSSLFLPL